MSHVIIGTAGHVDHGKTTLIKKLTGIDTDRLIEEKKRGITIELGFAYMADGAGGKIGIIDVPGHEKFIRHMLAGAGGVDIVLLVIDANEGVMPQTREHLDILQLLGVKRGIIVLTKIDAAESDWIEVVTEDVKQNVHGTFLQDAEIHPVSAYTGDGIEELTAAILRLAASCEPKNKERFARLPVDRVFSMKGAGTVITGTLTQGVIENGQTICVYPKKTPAKVRSIEVHDTKTEAASAGQRVALNLAGLKKEDIERGDVLAPPGALTTTSRIHVRLSMLANSERTIKNKSRVHFYSGTRHTIAAVNLLEKTELAASESCFAVFKLDKEIPLCYKDRFIIRFFSPIETLGGGVVINTAPEKRHPPDGLDTLYSGSGEEALNQFIRIYGAGFKDVSFYKNLTGFTDSEIMRSLKAIDKSVYLLGGHIPVAADFLEGWVLSVKEFLNNYHKEFPLKEGIGLETFKQKMFKGIEEDARESALSYLTAKKIIEVSDTVKIAGFSSKPDSAQTDIGKQIEAVYKEAKFGAPAKNEILQTFANAKSAQSVFDAMVKSGVLRHINGQTFFHQETYEFALDALNAYLSEHNEITLATFRDLISGSRKTALMLLEYFDSKKITIKKGDARIAGMR